MSTAIALMTVFFIAAFAGCLVWSIPSGEWKVKPRPQKTWKKKL